MEFDELKGLSKTDILEQFGDCYNVFFSDIWMYRVNEKSCFFCKKYMYIFFQHDFVKKIELKRLKANYLM